jgi:hypothetical protein
VSYRIYWDNYGKPILNLFGSIWFANLDILVNNVKYLHDDNDEYQQPNESCESSQPNEPQQRDLTKRVKYYDDIGYRDTTSTTLTGAVSELEHDLLNIRLNSPTVNIDSIHS